MTKDNPASPPVMLDPSKLAPGEHWRRQCTLGNCRTITQGGRAGLAAHQLVVHGQ